MSEWKTIDEIWNGEPVDTDMRREDTGSHEYVHLHVSTPMNQIVGWDRHGVVLIFDLDDSEFKFRYHIKKRSVPYQACVVCWKSPTGLLFHHGGYFPDEETARVHHKESFVKMLPETHTFEVEG